MKRHSFPNTSHAFLLEILLNILLFAVLLSVSLQLIMKAHSLTKETEATYKAVDFCDNVASLYESGDGSLSSISSVYPSGSLSQTVFHLNLNEDFQPVASGEETAYTLTASLADPAELSFTGTACDISLSDSDNESVYSLRACSFTQAVPEEREVE